jgi:hypothetical protein
MSDSSIERGARAATSRSSLRTRRAALQAHDDVDRRLAVDHRRGRRADCISAVMAGVSRCRESLARDRVDLEHHDH